METLTKTDIYKKDNKSLLEGGRGGGGGGERVYGAGGADTGGGTEGCFYLLLQRERSAGPAEAHDLTGH